jgi:hypothetical protein
VGVRTVEDPRALLLGLDVAIQHLNHALHIGDNIFDVISFRADVPPTFSKWRACFILMLPLVKLGTSRVCLLNRSHGACQYSERYVLQNARRKYGATTSLDRSPA